MLKIYIATSQTCLDQFISNTINQWTGWAFAQPDCGKVDFPAQFVIATEPKIKLATIQFLH